MVNMLLAIIYLAFISLGLPDSLLGSAWPKMYAEFGVPVSYAGIISMIIAVGTIVSSMMSDRMTRRMGTGKITALSVCMTALALFGFSVSHSFILLCIMAVPYGLGAGSIDAALNNYVALHYSSRHMSWLHCMWGLGASIGPYIMGYALTGGLGWNGGYRYIAMIQAVLTVILFVSLPLWKKRTVNSTEGDSNKALSVKEVLKIPGAKESLKTFFCYCAIEQTAGLWISSFMALNKGMAPEDAARLPGLFFLGITAGRAVSGFITMVMDDTKMVRLGEGIILAGICAFLLPLGDMPARIGLILIGLGCAPIYPCIIHSTPVNFGADKSQAIIGIQMASAYAGTCLMPPLFGLVADYINIGLLPVYLVVLLAVMVLMHERVVNKSKKG